MNQPTPGTTRDRKIEHGIQSPELRQAFRAARKAGWTYGISGSTHLTLINPLGERAAISTTSKGKIPTTLAKLKRMGLTIE